MENCLLQVQILHMHNLIILGGGESGTGAALLAKKKGLKLFLSDSNLLSPTSKDLLMQHDIPFEEGGHTVAKIVTAHEVIKSPGIPYSSPIIQQIQAANIPIIDEIEFAARYTTGFIIAITGSNGKTTTTHLIHHLLITAGYDAIMVGNMGQSFARMLLNNKHAYYIVELSSFQLEGIRDFKADIACLTNITPDHLNRYNYEMQQYVQTKLKIIQNMGKGDTFIYCQDDPYSQAHITQAALLPTVYPISTTHSTPYGAYKNHDLLHFPCIAKEFKIPIKNIPLLGMHNQYNVMMATTVAALIGISKEKITTSLPHFKGLAHRIEWVAAPHGISCYNDAKATNIEATYASLTSFNTPITWIVGGEDKGNDYKLLLAVVTKYVKAIICLGKDNSKIINAFNRLPIPICETRSMEIAVQQAFAVSDKGDTILLSPACASFDLFNNFMHKGDCFKKIIQAYNQV